MVSSNPHTEKVLRYHASLHWACIAGCVCYPCVPFLLSLLCRAQLPLKEHLRRTHGRICAAAFTSWHTIPFNCVGKKGDKSSSGFGWIDNPSRLPCSGNSELFPAVVCESGGQGSWRTGVTPFGVSTCLFLQRRMTLWANICSFDSGESKFPS